MPRDPIPTYFFAVAVVRRGERFLSVHERKHDQLWYPPARRVEPEETFVQAACRETLEEAGIAIRITGIIRVEHSPKPGLARMRVVFLGEPVDDTSPERVADDESLGADWVSLEELIKYPLRGEEVRELFEYVAAGGPVCPVSLLQLEGMPYLPSLEQCGLESAPNHRYRARRSSRRAPRERR